MAKIFKIGLERLFIQQFSQLTFQSITGIYASQNRLFRHIRLIISRLESVKNQTWKENVAAINTHKQLWLEAILDFETFIRRFSWLK